VGYEWGAGVMGRYSGRWVYRNNNSPSAIAVPILAAIAVMRTNKSVPLDADCNSGCYSGTAIAVATVVPL